MCAEQVGSQSWASAALQDTLLGSHNTDDLGPKPKVQTLLSSLIRQPLVLHPSSCLLLSSKSFKALSPGDHWMIRLLTLALYWQGLKSLGAPLGFWVSGEADLSPRPCCWWLWAVEPGTFQGLVGQ